MSVKHAFFGIFQKLTLFCCAIFFGFANAFSANLPSGYTEVEYIESTGTQYIDTNITGSTNAIIDMQGTPRTGDMIVFMLAPINATAYQNGFGQYQSTMAGDFDIATRRVYNVSYTSSSMTVNGVNVSSRYIANNVNLALFGSTATNRRIRDAKLYSAKIYNNDTLLRNFIPAKNSSGVVGMYDTVSGNFFTNQGTGEFAGGPMACPGGTLQTYTTVASTDVPAPVQNGTPTPTNPITPTFYTQGNMVLRKVGDIADSYDATTGKITRRIMAKVFNGTESFSQSDTGTSAGVYRFGYSVGTATSAGAGISTHFSKFIQSSTTSQSINTLRFNNAGTQLYFYVSQSTLENFKQWLAEQYAAGTPVTIYYPLATAVEEDWPAEQCIVSNAIKIATTAYNTARFNPVKTDLNNAVATIREIVTNTINQTAAIASLQADKQTRPEDACPAGKKCLLVETEENGVIVPHWFPIIEAPTD